MCIYIYQFITSKFIYIYIYKGIHTLYSILCGGFPDDSAGKESACDTGDVGDSSSIPGWGRFPGEGNGNPVQYSCLKNPMDRGAWKVKFHSITNSQKQLSN